MKNLELVKRYIESKEADDLADCIKNLIEKNGQEAGEGANAEVFKLNHETFGEICIKRSKKLRLFKINDEEREFDIQDQMYERGVSCPRPLVVVEDKISKNRYIAMKYIDGCTLGEVMENKQALPEKYDHSSFWIKVEKNIDLMHDKNGMQGSSVHHRDLHSYNIMIERSTGNPFIIDFGSSAEDFGGGDIYREDIFVLNENTEVYESKKNYPLKNDRAQINDLKKVMINKILTDSNKNV